MIRRCRTPIAAVAALFWLAGIAQAGKIITYDLKLDPKNPPAAGTPPVTQVFAYVHPAGSVGPDPTQPTPASYSPFNVLPGSSGFNADNLISYLGDGTLNTGDPIQVLRLQFDNNGFAGANASLKFSLDVNPTYSGPDPTLELVQGTSGVLLSQYTPPPPVTTPPPGSGTGTGTGTGNNGGTATVPEPMSIALWSAFAGLGLLRARAFRRGRLPIG